MKKIIFIFTLISVLISSVSAQMLKISPNRKFFVQSDAKPFFWLGDTGWLLFKKCSREETIQYLETRRRQGFNVIQVMLLHDVKNSKNFYGDEAIVNSDVSKLIVTDGKNFKDSTEYDYWDHVEWAIDEAAKRGLMMALVPIWGSNVKAGLVNETQAKIYAEFLAERFKNKPNVVWLNGGDLKGDEGEAVWKMLGATLRKNDPNHLITFHPRGRYSSSDWFHDEEWLDFNMFQSGHRNTRRTIRRTTSIISAKIIGVLCRWI